MRLFVAAAVAIAHACAGQGLPWIVGRNASLSVSGSSTYKLALNGMGLDSAPSFVHCNGKRFVDGTELTSSEPTFGTGSDPRLGPFKSVRFELTPASAAIGQLWSPPLQTSDVALSVKFVYYAAWDAFRFEQELPLGCSKGLNLTSLPVNETLPGAPSVEQSQQQLLGAASQYHSAIATSTGFPCFDASAGSTVRSESTGYTMWRGTFSDLAYSRGQALSEWLGGAETGPTVLFSAKDARDAMVLSATDSFFTATVGQASCRQLDPSLGAAAAVRGHGGESGGSCQLHPNTDFMGNDLGNVVVSTYQECCDACIADPQCSCWTFDGNIPGQGHNKCWLKTSTAGNQTASHMSGVVCSGDEEQITMGVQGYEQALLPGSSFSFVVFPRAARGIQAAMYEWGAFLRAQHGTTKLGPDVTNLLGYGTDNGAYYSGHIPMHSSYLTNASALLKKQGVPIRYMQLDPYWFSRQPDWVVNPDIFPEGIVRFKEELGVPLLLYSFAWSQATANFPAYKQRGFKFVESRKFRNYNHGNVNLDQFAQSDGVTS